MGTVREAIRKVELCYCVTGNLGTVQDEEMTALT